MKTKGYIHVGLVCLLAAIFTMVGVETAAAKAYRIKFGATSVRSGCYAFDVAKAKAVHELFPEIEVTVIETGGTVENLELLRRGLIEWSGHTNMAVGAAAYNGVGGFKGKAFKDLRQLWAPQFNPFTIFATKDSGVKSILELTGKKFGRRSGAADGYMIEALLTANGIKPKWMRAKAGALADATKGRMIIGWGKAHAPEASIMEIAAVMPITVLPVTAEMIEKGNSQYPGHFVPEMIPAGTYPGQDRDIPTIGGGLGDGCHKDMPEELAYKLVKAVFAKCNDLAASWPKNADGWKKERQPIPASVRNTVSPLHPGAVRFYREMGVTVPDRLIPPEMK